MASDTKNVKVGVCKIFYGGKDLGYTKGGVEVDVSSETYKVEVDQFGKTAISEIISSRNIKVTAPLAETTIWNMYQNFIGATLQSDGSRPTGSITLATNPIAANTVVVNGKTFTFRSGSAPLQTDVLLGATASATAANLYAVLKNCTDPAVNVATYGYVAGSNVVSITYDGFIAAASTGYTLSAGTSGATIGALTGGAPATWLRVDVADGVGSNLLDHAKELRLHPTDRPDTDRSDDLVIPLAATAGGMQFAYRLEEERVFNCEFMGYPDPTTRKLWHLGDGA